jgi:hypothetical protein
LRRGELSNQVLPRVYVVFENLIGVLPDTKTRALEAVARKRKKWQQAVDYYELSVKTTQGIRDLHRRDIRIDVITFVDPNFVDPIRNKLDSRNMFFGGIHYFTVESLLDDLKYDPSILRVFDPDPKHVLTWGSKGRTVTPMDLNLYNIL